ncbi:MAG: sigma-54-dependent Fis family transcriptional regulator [Nitrospirae bacterium]|nr:MAG: sigma-54-dependent Fis family transcriptional regulator [Nitrospirota bacterium]
MAMQGKLLRLLESGEIRRVGGSSPIRVDVRIVAATNRRLWEEVAAGRFRDDLYHRLACFTVELPPLRERLEDLPLLVRELLRHVPPPAGRPAQRISRGALEVLKGYDYPGNVRELRNVLQVAAARTRDGRIGAAAVEAALGQRRRAAAAGGKRPLRPAGVSGATAEERLRVAEALARYGGHRRRAAEALGISERTLYRKLKRYGLS